MQLRPVILTLFFCLFAFATTVYISCNKPKEEPHDPCKSVLCENGGYCEQGACNCPAGFKGPHCELKWNSRYLGEWIMLDSSADGFNAYTVYIRASVTDPTAIVIDSFWEYNASGIIATLINENAMEFKEDQNLRPGYHENYILKGGVAQRDETLGIVGSFILTHTGEPDKLHSFTLNR